MKLTPVIKENLLKIAGLNLMLMATENLGFFVLGLWDSTVLMGSFFGYIVSVVSFWLLGLSIQKAVNKEQKQAQMYMQSTYMGRMGLNAAMIIIAFNIPFFNWYAAIIPLIFTRISIMVLNFKKKEE